jgi:hypothetical protein
VFGECTLPAPPGASASCRRGVAFARAPQGLSCLQRLAGRMPALPVVATRCACLPARSTPILERQRRRLERSLAARMGPARGVCARGGMRGRFPTAVSLIRMPYLTGLVRPGSGGAACTQPVRSQYVAGTRGVRAWPARGRLLRKTEAWGLPDQQLRSSADPQPSTSSEWGRWTWRSTGIRTLNSQTLNPQPPPNAWFWVEAATCPLTANSLRNSSTLAVPGNSSSRDFIPWKRR